jgi:hypothetical protein
MYARKAEDLFIGRSGTTINMMLTVCPVDTTPSRELKISSRGRYLTLSMIFLLQVQKGYTPYLLVSFTRDLTLIVGLKLSGWLIEC